MNKQITAALQYAHEHEAGFLEKLNAFASIPSISTEPEYAPDIQRAAEWVAGQLHDLGMEQVTIYPTGGYPVVYGASLKAGPGVNTVLIYGHYDVQPAEPLELWESGPFEPVVRGENVYGRGVSDMKGQILACLDALEAITQTSGKLPVNVKILIEGEEEIGSPHLRDFILEHKELLRSDFALNPDTGMISPDLPTITYALRGLAYFEVRIYGPDHDLHSGMYGGVVHNPAQALCELIAGMHDGQGRITLPGFYDSVRLLDAEEREEIARLPTDEAFYLSQTGAPALWGENEYRPAERTGARPTLEVNGLLSGYTGSGTKTVLPAWAMAKVSMRLVPDQDPKDVYDQLRRYLEQNAPPTIRWEIFDLHGGLPSISERHSPGVLALSKALETVWGKRPLMKREGGSVPVVGQFQEYLHIESVNGGFSLYDDKAHSPNEKLHLPTWKRGIDALIHFFFNLVE
jgi:acetylornithine deacetylase/succinyl-diaminopimelate desuccinylase-like protein